MLRTIQNNDRLLTPTRPVVLRVVRPAGQTATARWDPHRPAWSLLYAIVSLALAGLIALEYMLPDGFVRTAGELLEVMGCIAMVRLWIGSNRWRLAQTEGQGGSAIQVQAGDGSSAREAG